MQYTESVVDCLKRMVQDHPESIDWQGACEQVKDPRRKQGQRFSLTSILLLALAAMLSNHVSELAIAEWGAGQSEQVKKALGFENGVTPHQTTIQRLFRRLNAEEVEAAFRQIFLSLLNYEKEQRGGCAVSIDGKVQKGRLKFEEKNGYPIHAVSLVDHQTGIVLTQGHVEKNDIQTRNSPAASSPKNKSERNTKKRNRKVNLQWLLALFNTSIGQAKSSTLDALYCQRCLCSALRLAGGDYLFLVKGNQPQLLEDLRLLFAPLPSAKRAGEGVLRLPEQHAQTTEKAHGRLDIRSIRVSSERKRLLRLA